jgi:phosphatidyl-myo-inositol alpha-mannosyltransferase
VRVTLVSPYSWTTPGGVGNHVENLAAQLRDRGHDVVVLAPADGPVARDVRAVGRSIPVPFNGAIARIAFGPRVAMRVRRALRDFSPDLVHAHEPFAPSVSMLAVQAAGVPCVATFHADASESRIYRAAGPILRALWNKLAVRIAVSEAARTTVERVFADGMLVIPNGIDVGHFASIPPADPSSRTVLFVGRLERRKGARVLIEAFARVPNAQLLIVGDGPEREACRAAAAPLGDKVEFLGRVEPAALPQQMARANIVCAPSLGGESFGVVLLEAMAAGRAVVASSIPGYAAVVRDGIDGLLVPPDDQAVLARALTELLDDAGRARGMGENGRENAARYDWSIVAGEIERVYEEALAKG